MSIRPAQARADSSGLDVTSYAPVLAKDPSPIVKPIYQSSRPANPTRGSTRSGGGKSSSSGGRRDRSEVATEKAKANPAFDVIDRLDISGLYGGGSFHRHDGPYAAATAHANRGPRAPINAFDPATQALAGSAGGNTARSTNRSQGGVSARAQAAMAAMGQNFEGPSSSSVGASSTTGLRRRNSDSSLSSVTLGFPNNTRNQAGNGKQNAQMAEVFGVRDNEAWQDFGRGRSAARERESSANGTGVSKEDRMARAISVWDMEQTLKAGKPVAAAPPPMPVMPTQFSDSSIASDASGRPKRSKSLVSRFRSARKGSASDVPPIPSSPSEERSPLSASLPPSLNRAQTDFPKKSNYSPTTPPAVFEGEDATQEAEVLYAGGAKNEGGVRFQGGPGLGSSKSEGAMYAAPMVRKRSLVQRLFGRKAS